MTADERAGGAHSMRVALVDVDRTLLKSEVFSAYVYRALGRLGVSSIVLQQIATEQASAQLNAFDYIARVAELSQLGAGDDIVDRVVDELANELYDNATGSWDAGFVDDSLVDGTMELLGSLDSKSSMAILCTSGGELTQRIKLNMIRAITGRDDAWIIVGADHQRKAAEISSFYDHQQQLFDMAGYAQCATASWGVAGNPRLNTVRDVDVIDDKWVNIADIPEGVPVRGWLVEAAELADDGSERMTLKEVTRQLQQHSIDK